MSTEQMRDLLNLMESTRSDAHNVDEFTRAYMEAAIWSSTDENDDPLDQNYDITDFSDNTFNRIIADCKQFQQYANIDSIEGAPSTHDASPHVMAGHDFWLTRNGHGAGFWDGDWPEADGARLTELSEKFKELDLYVGDDGQLHF
jgi:hypothetical protein